jgi:hypothetical protein
MPDEGAADGELGDHEAIPGKGDVGAAEVTGAALAAR